MSNNAIADHSAVYELHPNVDHILQDEATGEHIAYASDGSVMTFTDAEVTAMNAKSIELANADELDFLRTVRNQLLAETDHWMFSDTTTATQAQLDYRQALRDITDTYSNIGDVVWPTKP